MAPPAEARRRLAPDRSGQSPGARLQPPAPATPRLELGTQGHVGFVGPRGTRGTPRPRQRLHHPPPVALGFGAVPPPPPQRAARSAHPAAPHLVSPPRLACVRVHTHVCSVYTRTPPVLGAHTRALRATLPAGPCTRVRTHAPPNIQRPQALTHTQHPKNALPSCGVHASPPRDVSLVPRPTGTRVLSLSSPTLGAEPSSLGEHPSSTPAL